MATLIKWKGIIKTQVYVYILSEPKPGNREGTKVASQKTLKNYNYALKVHVVCILRTPVKRTGSMFGLLVKANSTPPS